MHVLYRTCACTHTYHNVLTPICPQLSRVQKACFDALVQALVGLGGELELDDVWFVALYTVQLVSGALAAPGGRLAPYSIIRLPPLASSAAPTPTPTTHSPVRVTYSHSSAHVQCSWLDYCSLFCRQLYFSL